MTVSVRKKAASDLLFGPAFYENRFPAEECVIKAIRIGGAIALENEILLDRVHQSRSDRNQEFLIMRDGTLVGLLIYEGGEYPYDFIYEIFVLREFRGGGIGTWILAYAEQIAAQLGKAGVRLQARSLSPDERSHDDLTAWYERKGYVRCAPDKEILEKRFAM